MGEMEWRNRGQAAEVAERGRNLGRTPLHHGPRGSNQRCYSGDACGSGADTCVQRYEEKLDRRLRFLPLLWEPVVREDRNRPWREPRIIFGAINRAMEGGPDILTDCCGPDNL